MTMPTFESSELPSVEILTAPDQAAAVLRPDRRRVLEVLREPGSATTVGARLGLPRQRVNYHLRELEKVGLVRLVATRRRRNCTERMVQAPATRYVVRPEVLEGLAGDAADMQDRFSSAYLVALAARTIRELGELRQRARGEGKRLATLALQADVRFASAADRATVAEELATEVARVVDAYDRPDARGASSFRMVVGVHPALATDPRPGTRDEHPEGAMDDRTADA
jgi:DNA-binding transcriptional ArsR family regulator